MSSLFAIPALLGFLVLDLADVPIEVGDVDGVIVPPDKPPVVAGDVKGAVLEHDGLRGALELVDFAGAGGCGGGDVARREVHAIATVCDAVVVVSGYAASLGCDGLTVFTHAGGAEWVAWGSAAAVGFFTEKLLLPSFNVFEPVPVTVAFESVAFAYILIFSVEYGTLTLYVVFVFLKPEKSFGLIPRFLSVASDDTLFSVLFVLDEELDDLSSSSSSSVTFTFTLPETGFGVIVSPSVIFPLKLNS